LEVWHGDERLVLRPQEVGFEVDVDALLSAARAADAPGRLVRYLIEDSLERPPQTVDVPIMYRYDDAALEAWLDKTMAERDRPAGAPIPMLEELTLKPGQPGLATDRAEAKKALLVTGLAKAGNRSVKLPVQETPPPPMDVKALGTLLQARLDEFPGIGSVWLHYLPDGRRGRDQRRRRVRGHEHAQDPHHEQVYRKLDHPPGHRHDQDHQRNDDAQRQLHGQPDARHHRRR
jgi:hypothetical protein